VKGLGNVIFWGCATITKETPKICTLSPFVGEAKYASGVDSAQPPRYVPRREATEVAACPRVNTFIGCRNG